MRVCVSHTPVYVQSPRDLHFSEREYTCSYTGLSVVAPPSQPFPDTSWRARHRGGKRLVATQATVLAPTGNILRLKRAHLMVEGLCQPPRLPLRRGTGSWEVIVVVSVFSSRTICRRADFQDVVKRGARWLRILDCGLQGDAQTTGKYQENPPAASLVLLRRRASSPRVCLSHQIRCSEERQHEERYILGF